MILKIFKIFRQICSLVSITLFKNILGLNLFYYIALLLRNVILFFLFYASSFAQNQNPLFELFYNHFFAYPFSGWGHRNIYRHKQNLEKIYFHSQIPFAFAINLNSKWYSMILFKNNLKMYNEPNFPVKTPDYKIDACFSYIRDSSNQTLFALQHHSNGQKDSLFFANGKINFDNGNFSVNAFKIYWTKKFNSSFLKLLALQTEHLFFYFSMGYMKSFYYHHTLQTYAIFHKSLTSSLFLIYHFNLGFFFQPQHKTRLKFDFVTQLNYKNRNLMPFLRAYYGPDEYNSRYLYQNFHITLGISTKIQPFHFKP